jgi:hypothetical protein
MHPLCFVMLTEVLTGTNDPTKVDKDTLFDAMVGLENSYCLNLNYGGVLGAQYQRWRCIPGEEVRDCCWEWPMTVLPTAGRTLTARSI